MSFFLRFSYIIYSNEFYIWVFINFVKKLFLINIALATNLEFSEKKVKLADFWYLTRNLNFRTSKTKHKSPTKFF